MLGVGVKVNEMLEVEGMLEEEVFVAVGMCRAMKFSESTNEGVEL